MGNTLSMAVPPFLHLLLLPPEPFMSLAFEEAAGRGVKMDGVTQLILPFLLSQEEVSNLYLSGDLYLRKKGRHTHTQTATD